MPQTSGTITVTGLSAPVRVVRDRHGVPHIYAQNPSDLFTAQGFVQAQDRLFQMDLWRRASQGRLAEILGANFGDRDTMTRRIQYRGDLAAEWASYGTDAKAIAGAFVRGINAYVSMARERPPEEFAIAGWPPSYWFADDLLNRTDAFVAGRGPALDRIRRERLPDVVAEAVRQVGTPPFFVGSGPPDAATHARDGRTLSAPSPQYLVHLIAPGWNVIGATPPWMPGVVIGHDDRASWDASSLDITSPDVVVDGLDRVPVTPMPDFIRIKGRPRGMTFTRDTTPRGIVIATDREHNRAYVLRWRGFEPGGSLQLRGLTRENDARGVRVEPRAPPPDQSRGATDSGRADDVVVFAHVLGVGGRSRFNVGPVPRPPEEEQTRLVFDRSGWDRSRGINAPGQSGSLASPHYADAAVPWSADQLFELWFSEDAVRANAEATLTLTPRP